MNARTIWMATITFVVLVAIAIATFLSGRSNPPTTTPPPDTTSPIITLDPTPSSTAPAPDPAPDFSAEDDTSKEFNINNPPEGAMTAEEAQLAAENARQYWLAVNDYGAGDQHWNDFIDRARPWMTDNNWEGWGDLKDIQPTQSDLTYWNELQTRKVRHKADIEMMVVTRWDKDSLLFTVVYRVAENKPNQPVPAGNPPQQATLLVLRDGGKWRVDHGTPTS